VPLSLLGTFAVMYVVGFSLDNLSLMALTIAVGFVVDDAIVVVENIFPVTSKRENSRIRPQSKAAGRDRVHCLFPSPLSLVGGVYSRSFSWEEL